MNDKKSIDKKHVVSTKLYSNHEEGFILQCNGGFCFEKSGFSKISNVQLSTHMMMMWATQAKTQFSSFREEVSTS